MKIIEIPKITILKKSFIFFKIKKNLFFFLFEKKRKEKKRKVVVLSSCPLIEASLAY
jgi:hypothetical protein